MIEVLIYDKLLNDIFEKNIYKINTNRIQGQQVFNLTFQHSHFFSPAGPTFSIEKIL